MRWFDLSHRWEFFKLGWFEGRETGEQGSYTHEVLDVGSWGDIAGARLIESGVGTLEDIGEHVHAGGADASGDGVAAVEFDVLELVDGAGYGRSKEPAREGIWCVSQLAAELLEGCLAVHVRIDEPHIDL